MERERSEKENVKNEYQSILPEIAKLLNISVSMVEHYPADMQKLLCQVYVNNYPLGEQSTKQALSNAVNLDFKSDELAQAQKGQSAKADKDKDNAEKEQERAKRSCSESEKKRKTYFLTRKQIIENAKTISKNSAQNELRKAAEQIAKSNNTT